MHRSNKTIIGTLVIIVAFYFFMSYHGYQAINSTLSSAEEHYEIILAEVERGNTYLHAHIQRYNGLVNDYERQQRLIPTFWLNWIFNFPALERADYNDFRDKLDQQNN